MNTIISIIRTDTNTQARWYPGNRYPVVEGLLRVGPATNQTFLLLRYMRFFTEIKYKETSSKGRTIVDRSSRTCSTT